MSLRVLYIGGTGVISSACVRASLALDHEVHVLHRGSGSHREPPGGVVVHQGDVRDPASVRRAIGEERFDVVADFVAFSPEHVRTSLALFAGRSGQYVLISTTAAYQKPAAILPIRESTPLRNPYFAYARDKIACEDVLVHEYRERGTPVTVVRPSHTYDRTLFPMDSGWTVVQRMREGRPVVLPDGGRPLCALSYADDFAATFVRLLGDPRTHGEAFHITSDEAISWRQAFDAVAVAAGAVPRYVAVPSEVIATHDAGWGEVLLGDRAHSSVFDSSKVRSLVPQHGSTVSFAEGARRIVAWYDTHPEAQVRELGREALMDRLVAAFDV
ncbi:NAD-dependent epimerase/dehydratase family protein [Xylanimonas protaetiae]|uniref:NAD-dependent epimerase/dehydratase family protein n=1 Tax=Xylanimonas protaetiae TaxID=2509457 RepID=UPI0026985B0A